MSNAFADAARSESRRKLTDNGAKAYASTGNAMLDLFSSIGAMRNADETTITTLLADAYKENPLLAAKAMFYTRDIRGERVGKGERKTFRTMLKWMANNHPEAVIPNIPLIGVYGRYDDLYTLIDTPCESAMWEYMKEQIDTDYSNMCYNRGHEDGKKKPVSLLCKWMKSIHTSSAESRALAVKTYKNLGFPSEKMYRQILSEMRAYIPVLERQMSDGKWDEIDYEHIPAVAMKTYRAVFDRHDIHDTFFEYKQAVKDGTAKINASTLFPYDLVSPYLDNYWDTGTEDDIIEAQWKAMPDYIGKEINALVMCDVSGSMFSDIAGRHNLPIKAAVGLAIYFAEHNKGEFHNLFMTFSGNPNYVTLRGETLCQKVKNTVKADWANNTNMHKAFRKILQTGVDNKLSNDEMPKAIIVISDMQIDSCTNSSWSFYHDMKKEFALQGYEIPRVIFWNVNCAKPTMLVDDKNRDGVQLISGLNAKTFAEIIDNVSATAEELMMNCLTNPRYDAVTINN